MLSERGREIAAIIDHTLLKADATPEQIRELCAEARDYGFYAVCVNPYYVRLASESLAGSAVRVVAVAGFPLGASVSEAKAFEARRSIVDGADEIDMVLNVGALKAGEFEVVEGDIAAVVAACREGGAICKVIIETGYLSDAEKIEACRRAVSAGANFVKTSTGFGPGGATSADVALMRATVGPDIGVKAAGGIRTFDAAQEMMAAGASRIGASASVQIVRGAGRMRM